MSEALIGFTDIIMSAPNDDSALKLCDGLPSWFSVPYRNKLQEMANNNYYARTFGIGDMRSEEQIHQDAIQQQTALIRLAPKILAANPDASSTP